MRDLNRVTLLGNLTRDPEVKTTPNGQSVATFTVATNRSWTTPTGEKQDAVEFVDCVAWGKLGEIIGQILHKGSRVYTEGRLQTRSWEGQDGVKRFRTEVIVSDFSALDRAGTTTATPPEFTADSNFSSSTPDEANFNQDVDFTPPSASKDDQIDINDIPF